MTKFLLDDQEENGYDDSDFFAIFFDTETGTIKKEMYGSTRGPSPRVAPAEYIRDVPAEIMAQAREILIRDACKSMKASDRRAVDEPETVSKGEGLTLLVDGFFKDKKTGEKIEYRAGETGSVIWVGNFGTFYRNGYNRPGRQNCRVGIALSSGRTVFVGLEKCKLSRPYLSDEDIEARARSWAGSVLFRSYFYLGWI
jgi:hypothetical protein